MGRPDASKQTRHVACAPSLEATGKPSGRTERERVAPLCVAGRGLLGESGLGAAESLHSVTKAAVAIDTWEKAAATAPGVASDGTRGRRREERMRSHEVAGCSTGVRVGIRREPPKSCPTPQGKSEEAIVAMKARTAEPAGAKGLYLSRASHGRGTV